MRNNIGYHTRNNQGVKLVGGSFGGQVDQETVERLVNVHFDVIVKPSGRAVFVDKEGREVSLYISVDPDSTEKGKTAIKEYRTNTSKIAYELSKCEHKSLSNGVFSDCGTSFDCCDCGGNDCGCRGCFSCNACDVCRQEVDEYYDTKSEGDQND